VVHSSSKTGFRNRGVCTCACVESRLGGLLLGGLFLTSTEVAAANKDSTGGAQEADVPACCCLGPVAQAAAGAS
jgi:hypothetical protein